MEFWKVFVLMLPFGFIATHLLFKKMGWPLFYEKKKEPEKEKKYVIQDVS